MSIGNEALAAVIRNRLLQDSRLAAMAIDVCSTDGFVCLMGMVDTHEQKRLAVQLATGMIGVRKVRDELGVRVCAPLASPGAPGDDWVSA